MFQEKKYIFAVIGEILPLHFELPIQNKILYVDRTPAEQAGRKKCIGHSSEWFVIGYDEDSLRTLDYTFVADAPAFHGLWWTNMYRKKCCGKRMVRATRCLVLECIVCESRALQAIQHDNAVCTGCGYNVHIPSGR